jgi:hypothetical protein
MNDAKSSNKGFCQNAENAISQNLDYKILILCMPNPFIV